MGIVRYYNQVFFADSPILYEVGFDNETARVLKDGSHLEISVMWSIPVCDVQVIPSNMACVVL